MEKNIDEYYPTNLLQRDSASRGWDCKDNLIRGPDKLNCLAWSNVYGKLLKSIPMLSRSKLNPIKDLYRNWPGSVLWSGSSNNCAYEHQDINISFKTLHKTHRFSKLLYTHLSRRTSLQRVPRIASTSSHNLHLRRNLLQLFTHHPHLSHFPSSLTLSRRPRVLSSVFAQRSWPTKRGEEIIN